MRKLSKTLLSLLLIAAMLASFVVLPAAAEEPAAEQPTEAVQAAETQADDAEKSNYELSVVMLDCGRKYFSVDSIKQIIDNAAAAGFNNVMLAVGNDGMRFLLDDMSLTVNGTTYSSEEVAAAIHTGNEAYYNFTTDELTESEMDEIIAYAKTKGLGIIPVINTPGHMDAILDAAEALTGKTCSYNGSARTIDVTNSTAVAFTQAFVQKYVDYFASKGCKYFNMGADEYANDMFTGGSMGFGNLQSTGKYSYYVEYVNAVAALIKNAGMTPMAFNDGIYFNYVTSSGTFDTDIVICYWSNGWGGYTPMPAETLASKGFKMVNTHGDYYWVLGKSDWQCNAKKASGFNYKTFQGGTIDNPSGAMFCIWADYPGAETEASVISKTADTIAAFGAKLPKIDDNKTVSDEATGVSVTAPGLTGITVAAVDKGTELDGKKVAGAWNIELTTENGSYTGSAAVKVPLDGNWTGCTITAGVMNENGGIDYGKDYDIKDGFLTFTAPHFSTVVVLAEEKQQEITVTVGGTYELPLAGNGTNETSKVLDDTYATVEVKHEYQEAKETLTKNDSLSGVTKVYISNDGKNFLSVSGNSLSNETTFADATEWTVEEYNNNEEYYLKSSNGYYLIASRTWYFGVYYYSLELINSTKPGGSDSNYRWKYTSNGFNNSSYNSYYIIHSSSETSGWDLSRSDSSTRGYAYTLVPTEEVNKTTITFTGKSEGSTQVEIDGVLYNINVVAVPTGAMTNTSLTLEYWITNGMVYRSSSKTGHTDTITTDTAGATSEDGVDITEVAPNQAFGFFSDDNAVTVYYWQSVRLDKDNKQTNASGDDETADGTTFTHVRYHAGAWQYKTLDGTWHYFLSTDQAVAYYLQKTKVTTEVDTYVKDWGYGTAGTTPNTSDGMGQVALTVAVVYPDGTVSPAEKDMYFKSTTIFNYWAGRDIGIIAPRNNSDYTISKITVTDGNRKSNSTANVWYASDTITWEKVTTDAGTEWYDETTVWDKVTNAGTTPMVNGKNSNITWSAKNTAKLVLIYLKPTEKETNLKVVYYDDTYSQVITNYDIAMKYVTGGKMPSFLTALQNNGKNVQTGVFELDDDAYVTNSSGVNQTFNKDVSTVAGVASQYKSGFYKYVQADISVDGKTMTLHFAVDETKLKSMYVIDFGLPVRIPISSFGMENPQEVTGVTVLDSELSYGTASAVHENDGWYIVYVPNKTLKAVETLRAEFTYSGHNAARLTIGLIPASTVYYEEGFATYDGTWNGTTNKGTGTQALTKLGDG